MHAKNYTMLLETKPRNFVPQELDITDASQVSELLDRLKSLPLITEGDLYEVLAYLSETEAVIGEQANWIQVRLTTDTANTEYKKAYERYVTETEPMLKEALFELQSSIVEHPSFGTVKQGKLFPYLRKMEEDVRIYRPEIVPLESEENLLSQNFGEIAGKMSIELDQKTYTLQQASKFLESEDRELRELVYKKIQARRGEDQSSLMDLFLQLRDLRHKIALEAGFQNYRDYKFAQLGRFDYTAEDCYHFHDNVKKYFVPLYNTLLQNRQKALGYDQLFPWDTDAPLPKQKELQPFEDGADLTFKSITLFGEMDSYFADCLKDMDSLERLDLDSRLNKAPGGYNCPMPETGVPFIFMNAAGTLDDVITMMHESGHAFHAFLTHSLVYTGQKEVPMEMAELASMSMELMTLDYWKTFLPHRKEHQQAINKELERVISVLPWVATIDKFQHWIYTNPTATAEQLTDAWVEIFTEFAPSCIDREGLEEITARLWQKQLHLYEVPFYYIEYGIAQIGAIELWINYRKHPKKTLDSYKNALSLGYTETLPELYQSAGITWGFGEQKMQMLAKFLSDMIYDATT